MLQTFNIIALAAFFLGIALFTRTWKLYKHAGKSYLKHLLVFIATGNVYILVLLIPYLTWYNPAIDLGGKVWAIAGILPIISCCFLVFSLNDFSQKKLLRKSRLYFFLVALLASLFFFYRRVFIDATAQEVEIGALIIQSILSFSLSLAFLFTTSLVKTHSDEQKSILKYLALGSALTLLIPLGFRGVVWQTPIHYYFYLIVIFTAKFALYLFYFLNINSFVKLFSSSKNQNNDPGHPKLALLSKYSISKRESEVISLICQGKTNNEISEALFISLQTVKDHTSRIYKKAGVKNRVQLANLFREPKI